MFLRTAAILLASTATMASAQTPPAAAPSTTPATTPATTSMSAKDLAALNALNARLAAPLPADQAALKSHVLFLASDALKGREAGSPEFDIAAEYVAAQFYAAGLRPAGDNGGYLQTVPLVSYLLDGTGSVSLNGAALVSGTDFTATANPGAAVTSVSGQVVFVGQGIVAPAYGRDDYAGVDVRGKIVVMVDGTPDTMTGEERAFFGAIANRAQLAGDRGAIGVLQLAVPRPAKSVRPARPAGARMTWATAAGMGKVEAAPVLGTLTPTGAAKLFAGARTPWTRVVKTADAKRARFTAEVLPATLSVASKTKFTPARSFNVAGMIPGRDPVLGPEVVVLSAHLDHVGVLPSGEGDRINNGALDDAIGIASLIEEAKRFQAAGAPRRSVMFLAVTAEEKGLVGSDYFAEHPTVPRQNIVANVNLDMPILTYKFEDLVAFGGNRSTLGPIIQQAASSIGVVMSPDPIPEQAIFVRSDHFRFVQRGIPSIFLWPGYKGPGRAASETFLATRYHKPSDDLTQDILWDQGVRFVDVNYRVARDIADADARPVWNKGDYFGTLFKGPMAQ